MRSGLLVTAFDLEQWANRAEFRALLPKLIRLLLLAREHSILRVSFPAGDSSMTPGWDGLVTAKLGDQFVPSGKSAWEISTQKDSRAKANEDYEKRKRDALDVDPSETTYVCLTARSWPGKKKWEKERRDEKFWRDVKVVDAEDLEEWLERSPAVHLWLSKHLGKHPYGARDLATFWEDWSEATRPATPAEFLLAGRSDFAGQVRDWLRGTTHTLWVEARTREEALAVFTAAIVLLPPDERDTCMCRTVVAANDEAWISLAANSAKLILIADFDDSRSVISRPLRAGHRIVIPTALSDASTSRERLRIPKLSRQPARTALVSAGFSEKKAAELVTFAAQNLALFRNDIALVPANHDSELEPFELVPFPWPQFRAACDAISASQLEGAVQSTEKLVRRRDAENRIVQFLGSNVQLLPVLGESGMGKTSLVAQLSRILRPNGGRPNLALTPESPCDEDQDEDRAILYYEADAFSRLRLAEAVANDLVSAGVQPPGFATTMLSRFLRLSPHRIVIVLDALNTHEQPIDLLRQLIDMLQQVGHSAQAIVTCQPSVWKSSVASIGASGVLAPPVSLGGYSEEEAAEAMGIWKVPAADAAALVAGSTQRDPFLVGLIGRHLLCSKILMEGRLMAGEMIPALLAHLREEHGMREEDARFLADGFSECLIKDAIAPPALEPPKLRAGYVGVSVFGPRDRQTLHRLHHLKLATILRESVGFSHERLRDHFLGQKLLQQRAVDMQPTSFYRRKLDALAESRSRSSLLGPIRTALLTDLGATRDVSGLVDVAFADLYFSDFLIATFETSSDSIIRLGLLRQILERAVGELPEAAPSSSDTIPRRDGRTLMPNALSAAHVAIETAQRVGDEGTLVDGLRCRDPRIRALAIQASYRLSHSNWEMAARVLRRALLKGRTLGVLPRRAPSEAGLALSVLLMSDLASQQASARLTGITTLRDTWLAVLRPVSFGLRNPVSRFLRGWLLDRILAMLAERTGEGGEYSPTNFDELRCTFSLPHEEMASFLRLVDALDATSIDIQAVRDDVLAATSRRDIISSFLVGALFARQVRTDAAKALQLAEDVVARELAEDYRGPGLCQTVWALYISQRKDGFDVDLTARMESFVVRYFSDGRNGKYRAASGRIYVSTFSDIRIIADCELEREPPTSGVLDLLKGAAKEDADFVRHILYDLAKLRHDKRYHAALLANMQWLVMQSTGTDPWMDKVLDILATVRQENALLVDEALLRWNAPKSLVTDVMSRSVTELIGADLMWGSLSLGFGDLTAAGYLDESMRPILVRILRRVANSRDLGDWLTFSARTVANAALGTAYFPEADV